MKTNRKALFSILVILSVVLQPFLAIEPVKADTKNTASVIDSVTADWPAFWSDFNNIATWWATPGNDDLEIITEYTSPNIQKITLLLTASKKAAYTIHFKIDLAVTEWSAGENYVNLSYGETMIVFDFSDVGDLGLKHSHSMKGSKFVFKIQKKMEKGETLFVDPSIVATSTNEDAVADGFQRKGFYAEGLFWAFYNRDLTDAGWEFSSDGTTWTGAFTSIGYTLRGHDFSICFDGTYIHYARWDASIHDLFYRRGTPVNDGTITWSADEQLIHAGISISTYKYPCITVDTDGYAWIGVLDTTGADDLPAVLKNANVDGTWTLDFAYELSAVDDSNWRACPVPLTDGKVYVIYCRNYQAPLGNLWNGAAWVGEENNLADYNIYLGYGFSAVALGNNVHFVYNRHDTYQIRHNERVWGVGWNASDVLVQTAVNWHCGPALSVDPSDNELYCFWTHNTPDHVYYKKYSGGAWGSLVDWIDESTDDIKNDHLISSFYMDYGGYIGLLYLTKLASPYNVKFGFLTMPPILSIENKGVEPSDSTVYDEQWFFLNASVEIQTDTTTFLFNRIDLDPTGLNISFSYTNSTDIFTEENDPNNYLQLDVPISVKTNINSTFVRVDYYIGIHPNVTKDGLYNVTVYSTASGDLDDEDVFIDVFTLTIRTPSAPTKLFGAGFNASSPYVKLHWAHALLIFTHFEVQNSSNKVAWDYLGQNATAAQYTDNKVVNGTERYYKVRACRNTGVGWKNSTFTDVNFETVYFVAEIGEDEAAINVFTGSSGIFGIILCIIVPIVAFMLKRR